MDLNHKMMGNNYDPGLGNNNEPSLVLWGVILDLDNNDAFGKMVFNSNQEDKLNNINVLKL